MINSEVFLMCKVSQGNWEKSKKKINRKEKKKEDRGKKGELESHGLVFLLLGPPLKFSSLPSLLSFSPSSSSSFSSSSPFLRLDSSSFFSLPSAMAEDKVLFLPAKMCFFFFSLCIVWLERKLSDPEMGELKMSLWFLLWRGRGWNFGLGCVIFVFFFFFFLFACAVVKGEVRVCYFWGNSGFFIKIWSLNLMKNTRQVHFGVDLWVSVRFHFILLGRDSEICF